MFAQNSAKNLKAKSRPHSSPDPSCGREISRGRANPKPQTNCFALPSPFLEFSIRILLEKSSDFVQETQPSFGIRIFAKIRSVAKRRDWSFRQNSPRVFEIQKERAGREAVVPDEYISQNEVL